MIAVDSNFRRLGLTKKWIKYYYETNFYVCD